MSNDIFTNKILKGIGVSSGIAYGKVRLLERGKIPINKRSIKKEQCDKEILKIKNAIKHAVDELNAIKQTLPDDEMRKHSFIIDAHILILQDEFFINSVIRSSSFKVL